MRLGCVGLGELGLAMAANLIEAGFAVTGYRRSSLAAFEALGGSAAGSAAEVMAASDVVVTCVSTTEALQEVIAGARGLAAAARPGQIVIDVTTAPIEVKTALRDRLAAAGAEMLDCPASGRPVRMRERQAPIFVSGEAAVVERCRPVLDALSQRHLYLGPFGAGSRMKFIANQLLAVHVMAAAEAMAVGTRAGFTPETIAAALIGSAADSAQLHIRAPAIARGQAPLPSGASAAFHDDLLVIRDSIASVGAVAPLFETALAWFEAAQAAGHGDQDTALMFTAMLRAQAAGTAG